MNPSNSIVIPFFNEAENVRPLLIKVFQLMESLAGASELVLVDDGSTDTTLTELTDMTADRAGCHIIHFERNRGQAAALFAGLERVRGEFVFTLDGDGQNEPADLARLLPLVANNQYDLVCGIRTPRYDSILRRTMSRVANRVRRHVLRDGLDDAGCQTRVFRHDVIAALRPSPLLQAFLPAMAAAAGFRVTQMPVTHHPRRHGKSKYGLIELFWRPAVEMLRLRRQFVRQQKIR